MNIQAQKISIGAESAVIVPFNVWEKIMSAMEDLDDIMAYDRAMKKDDGVRFSFEEVKERLSRKSKKSRETPTAPTDILSLVTPHR